ncbi:MAG: hypothetical protein P8L84_09760 [Methylococcaceae bacterium]|jgi:hypothetical protein|nr:hypothetical protein [Methylococcaceae bacterium]
MNKKLILTLLLIISLFGCKQDWIKSEDEQTAISSYSDNFLCDELVRNDRYHIRSDEYKKNHALLEKEIYYRTLISEKDIKRVKNKQIAIGMSQCALYLSWGIPVTENKSIGVYGVRIQHVFSRNKNAYVYTENGVITHWKESN